MAAPPRLSTALLIASLGCIQAYACPPPGLPPPSRYVGDVANDSQCTDDNIQSAINNAACPNTFIVISREHTYTQQHLSINNKSIILTATGNGVACNAGGGGAGGGGTTPTAPLVTISGNGSQSVFDISGNSNVTFQYLEITGGGGNSDSHGGGIDFNGTGSLTIDTSTVDVNHSGNGGGIEMNGNGGSATLTLKAYSIVESNTAAGNGGGINIEGSADLVAVQPFTFIGFNHAPNGKGGGIAVVDPAQANIGSPGYNDLAVVYGNNAALGGGISAEAPDGDDTDALINLFTTDPANPVAVSGNLAAQAGGAIYLEPSVDVDGVGGADFCASDFRIDGNSAPEGSAIYADTDSDLLYGNTGGFVSLNPPPTLQCGAASPGATPCAGAVSCNTLDGNVARDADNNPTPGSVILVQTNGFLTADRVHMRNNSGAHAIHVVDPQMEISNCLIADNTFTAEMAFIEDGGNGGQGIINNCTIVNNAHNSGSIIRTGLNLNLTYDILDQPAMSSVSTSGAPAIFADDILAADPTGLPEQSDIMQGEPIYKGEITGVAGDYHLAAFVQTGIVTASLGIDFAPPVTGDDRDLDNNPHDQDVPSIPNLFGDRDLGCYEAQPIADRIFGDAFGDPLSLVY